jgi:hypothetical protein
MASFCPFACCSCCRCCCRLARVCCSDCTLQDSTAQHSTARQPLTWHTPQRYMLPLCNPQSVNVPTNETRKPFPCTHLGRSSSDIPAKHRPSSLQPSTFFRTMHCIKMPINYIHYITSQLPTPSAAA